MWNRGVLLVEVQVPRDEGTRDKGARDKAQGDKTEVAKRNRGPNSNAQRFIGIVNLITLTIKSSAFPAALATPKVVRFSHQTESLNLKLNLNLNLKSMKRFLLLLMLVAPFVSWAQTSPEDVARAFVKSAFRKDIERAKSVSHSSFHAFLDRMADAELVEGADTTDRTDYTSFKFIQMGKDGMVQYMDNGKERTMFVTREDGEWKVDPFGAAGDYDIGRFMLNVHSQHDVDMEC